VNVDLFIRSYYKDLAWLSYCLRSVRKYGRGFRKVILVVPHSSAARLARSLLDHEVEPHFCEDFVDDYLGQQVTKLYADQYTDADYICHLDSDCLIRRAINPQELFVDGKILIQMTPYLVLPQAIGWQRLSERFMCRHVEYDFMRRQPFIFPRWLYPAVRAYAEQVQRRSLYNYILSQPPRGFSEYNAMGAVAYYLYFDKFVWRERTLPDPDESICRWFWSWEGISAATQEEIDKILS
jgi:hypothetical protein